MGDRVVIQLLRPLRLQAVTYRTHTLLLIDREAARELEDVGTARAVRRLATVDSCYCDPEGTPCPYCRAVEPQPTGRPTP